MARLTLGHPATGTITDFDSVNPDFGEQARPVVVEARLGDFETITGEWCDACRLPSAISTSASVIVGTAIVGRVFRRFCDDCGAVFDATPVRSAMAVLSALQAILSRSSRLL